MPVLVRPLLAEAGAAIGAVCVGLHVATALAPGHGSLGTRGLLLTMGAACLPCVRGLWLAPTRRVWAMTGAMYAAMLGAHLVVLTPWQAVPGGHVHPTGASWTEVGMWGGLALAAVEVLLAVVVLAGRAGARADGEPAPAVRQPSV
jgi:hypothetical protein